MFAFTACQAQLFVNLHNSFIVLSSKDDLFTLLAMALFIVEETVHVQVSSQLGSGTWQIWQSAKVGALMKIQTCVHSEGCKWVLFGPIPSSDPLWMLLDWSVVEHPGLCLQISIQLCSLKFPI